MNTHAERANFRWSIAELPRDHFKRGKYQDVILPLTVLRRVGRADRVDQHSAFRRPVRWLTDAQPIPRSHVRAALQSRMKGYRTCVDASDLQRGDPCRPRPSGVGQRHQPTAIVPV